MYMTEQTECQPKSPTFNTLHPKRILFYLNERKAGNVIPASIITRIEMSLFMHERDNLLTDGDLKYMIYMNNLSHYMEQLESQHDNSKANKSNNEEENANE
jgi:hypothetical protein